ncbi:MAG: L-seryl-tRNA(Sec) selenium transferase [Candidatus Cloacimonetes bacterium]|nr:L-seryl-tRNA(Sec) selenium transferase [Candidatus Cloacimonadota bacterium]
MSNEKYRQLPGVDILLQSEAGQELVAEYDHERVAEMLRQELTICRDEIAAGNKAAEPGEIVQRCKEKLAIRFESSLKPVINGSGIVLHTNLGRAPLGSKVMADLAETVISYCNLEFDLEKGERGQRNDHVQSLLQELTGAEAAIVVNNNAAAVFLILQTLAGGREVIVSRGELIEIGGSFRIPDIMEASGAIMREVGCTNRTRIKDYEEAITENTAMLFKAHKSNYYIGGFTEEVEVVELAELAHKHNLIMVYDQGNGLLRKPENLLLEKEPDVQSALTDGADIVCFSGDKLLGGPQAGIIAGKKEYVKRLAKAPLMRALRVGKLTISALLSVMKAYLRDKDMIVWLPIFEMLNRSSKKKLEMAETLKAQLAGSGIKSEIVESFGRCGGGTMPELQIPSYAVKIILPRKEKIAEQIYYKLLKGEKPVLGILREGELLFDVLSLSEKEFKYITEELLKTIEK